VEKHIVFGTRFSKEVVGVGLALGLTLALAVPISRLMIGTGSWVPPADGYRSASHSFGTGASYNLHVVPYGLDRGGCDRPRLAADLKSGNAIPSDLLIGNAVGAKMDAVDQNCAGNAMEFAPDQRRVLWRNADNGLTYTLVATQTFQNERGTYCREYEASTVVAGQRQQAHGVACRQPSGTWAAAH
jgi:surface antigen